MLKRRTSPRRGKQRCRRDLGNIISEVKSVITCERERHILSKLKSCFSLAKEGKGAVLIVSLLLVQQQWRRKG